MQALQATCTLGLYNVMYMHGLQGLDAQSDVIHVQLFAHQTPAKQLALYEENGKNTLVRVGASSWGQNGPGNIRNQI